MDATVAEKGWMLVLLVALPVASLGLMWVLGLLVGYLRDRMTGWRVVGVLALIVALSAGLGASAWVIFYAHSAYNWLPRNNYLWIVIPMVALLILAYLMGERRKTLWNPVACCLDCIEEECL